MSEPVSNTEDKKAFYRIKEVAAMLNVAPSLLRFWEKEIECLQTVNKNRKGDRLYNENNIKDLQMVYKLVKVKGMTLHGANEFMNKHRDEQSTYNSLMKIRDFLEKLKDKL